MDGIWSENLLEPFPSLVFGLHLDRPISPCVSVSYISLGSFPSSSSWNTINSFHFCSCDPSSFPSIAQICHLTSQTERPQALGTHFANWVSIFCSFYGVCLTGLSLCPQLVSLEHLLSFAFLLGRGAPGILLRLSLAQVGDLAV